MKLLNNIKKKKWKAVLESRRGEGKRCGMEEKEIRLERIKERTCDA